MQVIAFLNEQLTQGYHTSMLIIGPDDPFQDKSIHRSYARRPDPMPAYFQSTAFSSMHSDEQIITDKRVQMYCLGELQLVHLKEYKLLQHFVLCSPDMYRTMVGAKNRRTPIPTIAYHFAR